MNKELTVKELLHNRFILFVIFLAALILANYIFTGSFFPTTDTKDLWFYSGIFMVLFSILFIEPYYTSPKNVITNTIPLLLVFLSIKNSFENQTVWCYAVGIILSLLVVSIIANVLCDENESPSHWKNRYSTIFKNKVVLIGKGKVIYSAVFFLFLYVNVTSAPSEEFHKIFSGYFSVLLILWALILTIDPKELNNTFSINKKQLSDDAFGDIVAVQSRRIFLVKLFKDERGITKFDIVKFRYSMQESKDLTTTGIVFDTYLLNQEKWAKVLQLGKLRKTSGAKLEKNVVYKISAKAETEELSNELRVNNLVGVVIEGSNIGKIKFEYSKKQDDIQEGDLLELEVNKRRLFYQVINGTTEKEKLEARNETGFIKGEAIQLGEWQSLSFQKFGWVPSINTPVFKADTSNILPEEFNYPAYKLGVIPGTSLPSIIDLSEAVSHHMAILGVTGCGKSFITKYISEELLKDTRVICIDFTGEWKKKVDAQNYQSIDNSNIEEYLGGETKKIGIFELPALSNTTDVLKITQNFLEKIFEFAKTQYEQDSQAKIALILEEAHTITPETSFLGDMGDYSSNKALVNKMTQVALQGRKYGVGLLVIAQRTANVSKTVLTQCNTVICFQAFDETSFTFLGNYVGKDMVQALPNLKQYHAIVAGKALKSNMPIIVDLKR